MKPLRIGLIGAGANTRTRHIPGFLSQEQVELIAVCNRRPETTKAVADEFNIPKKCTHWKEIIDDEGIDAVCIGTWPYLHCPITLAALRAKKHVLTEARMSMNAEEAHRMASAAKEHADRVTQIVPSPFGFKGHHVMVDLLDSGFLGELREARVTAMNGALADSQAPLSWRQDAALSGYNMLLLGIVHETLLRWTTSPTRVTAQVQAHIGSRIDPSSGVRRAVGTPDSVQVLAVLENGAAVSYHLSGAAPFGQTMSIHLHGTTGALHYDLHTDRIWGWNERDQTEWIEIPIPPERAGGWRVEEEFVQAIRTGSPIQFTDFETGVQYMEFTEAAARSAESRACVELPLRNVMD